MTNDEVVDHIIRSEDSTLSGICRAEASDKGGMTKWGITHVSWGDWRKSQSDSPKLPVNICDVTLAQARRFYNDRYLVTRGLEKVEDPQVRLALADWMINSGSALKTLQPLLVAAGFIDEEEVQKELSTLKPNLLDAINRLDPRVMAWTITLARLVHYTKLVASDQAAASVGKPGAGRQVNNLHGWINRVFADHNIKAFAGDEALLRTAARIAKKRVDALKLPAADVRKYKLVFTAPSWANVIRSVWTA